MSTRKQERQQDAGGTGKNARLPGTNYTLEAIFVKRELTGIEGIEGKWNVAAAGVVSFR